MIDEETWENTGSGTAYETLDDNYKSSKYWLEIPFLGGDSFISDKKIWHKDFAREEIIGRTDFNIWLRKVL